MSGIEPRSAWCQANALLALLSLWHLMFQLPVQGFGNIHLEGGTERGCQDSANNSVSFW